MTQARESISDRLRSLLGIFWRELAKFGVVGAVAFVIDLGGFNLLFYGPLSGRLATSKIIAGGAATAVAWLGNRFWTFRHRRNRPVHHEAVLFFVVNGIGLAIATAYLNATHDLLHLTSARWVNVNNVVGIALATVFRFYAYRRWVFAGEHPGDVDGSDAPSEAQSPSTPAGARSDHPDSP